MRERTDIPYSREHPDRRVMDIFTPDELPRAGQIGVHAVRLGDSETVGGRGGLTT